MGQAFDIWAAMLGEANNESFYNTITQARIRTLRQQYYRYFVDGHYLTAVIAHLCHMYSHTSTLPDGDVGRTSLHYTHACTQQSQPLVHSHIDTTTARIHTHTQPHYAPGKAAVDGAGAAERSAVSIGMRLLVHAPHGASQVGAQAMVCVMVMFRAW